MKAWCSLLLCVLLSFESLLAVSKCGDDQAFIPFTERYVKYHNVIAHEKIKEGQNVSSQDNLGRIRERPKPLTPNDELFEKGQELYGQNDFENALRVFLKIYKIDEKNPFVLNALARTWYKMPNQGGRSIKAYLYLMKIIEAGYFDSEKYSVLVDSDRRSKSKGTMVIDPWFLEAYWKLGTLYLDYQEYPKAIVEMSKMYYYEFNAQKQIESADFPMAGQLFGYLTEAYFHTRNAKANSYFYCRTKEIDPGNKYVDQFLIK